MALTGCCCCFNLRRGSMAIGITFLVLYSLLFVAFFALHMSVIVRYHSYSGDFDDYQLDAGDMSFVNNSDSDHYRLRAYNGSLASDYGSDFNHSLVVNTTVAVDVHHDNYGAVLVVSKMWRRADLGILAIHLVFNGIFICGIKRESTCMILTWLIYDGITQAAHSVLFLAGFVLSCVSSHPVSAAIAVVMLALTAVFWYWFAVVLQFYRVLRQPPGQTVLTLGKVGSDE